MLIARRHRGSQETVHCRSGTDYGSVVICRFGSFGLEASEKSRESTVGVAHAKGRANAAAAAANGQAQPGARSEPQCDLLSGELLEYCGAVNTLTKEASLESMVTQHPCLITIAPSEQQAFFADKCLKAALEEFAESFSAPRTSQDKVLKRCEGPANSGINSVAADMAATLVPVKPDSIATTISVGDDESLKPLAECMTAHIFGIRASHVTFANEKCFLPTLRICRSGTRNVVMTPITSIEAYLLAMGSDKFDYADVSHVRQRCASFLKNLKKEALQAYIVHHPLLQVTVGPGDSLFVPAGWFFAERAMASEMVLGVRIPLVTKDRAAAIFFESIMEKDRQLEKQFHAVAEAYAKVVAAPCTNAIAAEEASKAKEAATKEAEAKEKAAAKAEQEAKEKAAKEQEEKAAKVKALAKSAGKRQQPI